MIAISSGHGKHVAGAIGIIKEHEEAVRVVNQITRLLQQRHTPTVSFEDTTSRDQSTNLNTIVDWHNKQDRKLDISIHFNASDNHQGHGVEVLYVTQQQLARDMSAAISSTGLHDRGAKYRDDLYFLSATDKPAILIEVCFCDNAADCDIYNQHFDIVCQAIANTLTSNQARPPQPPDIDTSELPNTVARGKVSHFGGPEDLGVAADEGLAFIYDVMDAPHLFLPYQPPNTTGLARRLNPNVHYIAMRWNYSTLPKATLLQCEVIVRSPVTGISLRAFPADWGPNENTGRIADISPGLMMDLGLETDDEVEVIFPVEST